MSTFIDPFREAVGETGLRRSWSPAGYIEAWRSFVTECEEGYQWDIYEYGNELNVRDAIEKILSDANLADGPEIRVFSDATDELDSRFESVLAAGPQIEKPPAPWWHRRVPARAGEELAADIEAHYSVRIELSDHLV